MACLSGIYGTKGIGCMGKIKGADGECNINDQPGKVIAQLLKVSRNIRTWNLLFSGKFSKERNVAGRAPDLLNAEDSSTGGIRDRIAASKRAKIDSGKIEPQPGSPDHPVPDFIPDSNADRSDSRPHFTRFGPFQPAAVPGKGRGLGRTGFQGL
jgi:hypothetical protein